MISPSISSPTPTLLSMGPSARAGQPAPAPGLLNEASVSDTKPAEDTSLREAFDTFVGETFYGTMLKSMRHSLGKPAYFYGGRGEEVFQGQLDQTLVEEMSKASADQLAGPMFELFALRRG